MKRAWRCDYCESVMGRAVDMRKHECGCEYNPANRTCSTCKHERAEWLWSRPVLRCKRENPRKQMKFQQNCAKWEVK